MPHPVAAPKIQPPGWDRWLTAALVIAGGVGCGADAHLMGSAAGGSVRAGVEEAPGSADALAQLAARASARGPETAGVHPADPALAPASDVLEEDEEIDALLDRVDERDLLASLQANLHHLYAVGDQVLQAVPDAQDLPPADPAPGEGRVIAELKRVRTFREANAMPQGVTERVSDAELAAAVVRAERVMVGEASQRAAEEMGQELANLAAHHNIFLPQSMQASFVPSQGAEAFTADGEPSAPSLANESPEPGVSTSEEDDDDPAGPSAAPAANRHVLQHLDALKREPDATTQWVGSHKGTLTRTQRMVAYLRRKMHGKLDTRSRISLDRIAAAARKTVALYDHARALPEAVAGGALDLTKFTLDVHDTLTQSDEVDVNITLVDDEGNLLSGVTAVVDHDQTSSSSDAGSPRGASASRGASAAGPAGGAGPGHAH